MKSTILSLLIAINCFYYQAHASGDLNGQLVGAWFQAIQSGDLETIQNLIGKIDINARGRFGTTGLIAAVQIGNETIVKLLLQAPDINVNAQDKDGCTALMAGAMSGNENIVKLLLQAHNIKYMRNNDGFDALCIAALGGHENIIKLLLQVPGYNINNKTKDGHTALILTTLDSHERQESLIKYLLTIPGIDLNAQESNSGKTALISAASNGFENVVKLLLQAPAVGAEASAKAAINVNAQDTKGKNAHVWAEESGHISIEKLIKDRKEQLRREAHDSIKRNKLENLKTIIAQLRHYKFPNPNPQFDESFYTRINEIDNEGLLNELLLEAIVRKRPEIVSFLLQATKDPREALSYVPFELIDPNSNLFQYFIYLAFGQAPN